MKKVININFKGRVIPIEEAAFEQLQKYTESLRRYFAKEEGRDEIINDIEDRIAELFDEELKKGAICISEASVSNIVASMGSVEDFEELDNEPGTTNGHSNSSSSATSAAYATADDEPRGSLSRNANDKILGGVCSGIAHNLKIDPSIVRIIFALITLGGFGAGVLIYIIMWVILPVRDLKTNIRKRLFRSPDEKVLGGVAGGLANYFNIPVWIPRLIFCLPLILGVFSSVFHNMWFRFDFEPRFVFGGFGGTLFVTYVVLWIVLPKASSATDKLQMRGEKIDVNSIKNAVQEELGSTGSVKERAAQMSEEIKAGAQKMSATITEGAQRVSEEISSKSKAFAVEAGPVAKSAGNGIGNAIGILFKAFFLFIAGIIAFALLIAMFGITMSGITVWPLKDFFFEGAGQNFAVWGTLFFFFFVPVIAFFIWVIRRIFGIRSKNSYLGWIFSGLWTIGWISLFFLVGSIFRNFNYYESAEQTIPVTQPAGKNVIVKVSEPALRYSGHYAWIDENNGDNGWDINEDTLWISNVKVRVQKSEDSAYSVKTIRYSYGQSRKDAEQKAGKIIFNTSFKDSVLDLGNGIAIDKVSKFRGQRVLVLVSVPVGSKIRFDKSLSRKLHPFNVRINPGHRRNWRDDSDFDFDVDMSFDYDADTDYIMTASDGLQRADGKSKVNSSDDNTNQQEINDEMKTIQEQKKELERKEQELKQKSKDTDSNRYRYSPGAPKAPEKNNKQIVQRLTTTGDAALFQPMTVNAL